MQFNKLHLLGFKSFVDPTSLLIEPGMTGIVGPNGCGKSNLVEALRWVMGETSPKRMRGSEMDDVIFGGTATRPARNNAEVELTLDNAERTATAEFNNADELVISRRIERDIGSEYRVNGRPVRQRDVHLIFADQATGAHANNIVGQGQIDALIRAKPSDRRAILEEAAGTSGLHARRHEAELKLRAAEQNLTRVDDVLNALDTQHRSLKSQMRQATRYRNLTEQIRKNEAVLLFLKWQAGLQQKADAEGALQRAVSTAADLTSVVTQGETKRVEAAAELPALRQAEAIAATILQKFLVERDRLEAEISRVQEDIRTQQELLKQASSDHGRETGLLDDALKAVDKLKGEATSLLAASEDTERQLPDVQHTLTAMQAEVADLERQADALADKITNVEALKQALTAEISQLDARTISLNSRRLELQAQRSTHQDDLRSKPDLGLALSMVQACETDLQKKEGLAASLDDRLQIAEQTSGDARRDLETKKELLTRLRAEQVALQELLRDSAQEGQVIDQIVVAAGLETALAIALGEALSAPLSTAAAVHWRELPPLMDTPDLPLGAVPLSNYVQAPPALHRSLTMIGLVESGTIGEGLCNDLKPGQILVSRDGWAWRWDGYTVTPQAQTTAAIRLKQQNRLTQLKGEIDIATLAMEKAAAARDMAEADALNARQQCNEARQSFQISFKALDDARRHHGHLAETAAAIQSRVISLDEAIAHVTTDLELVQSRIEAARTDLGEASDATLWRTQMTQLREQLNGKRTALADKQAHAGRVEQLVAEHRQRLSDIETDLASWLARREQSTLQLDVLGTRIMECEAALAQLQQRPAEITNDQNRVRGEIADAEAKRTAAQEALVTAENVLAAIEQKLKRDEAALTEAREEKVRAEAQLENNAATTQALRERITEKLDCEPEQLLEVAGIEMDNESPDLTALEEQLLKAARERENMGPVNMRAEIESQEIETKLETLRGEKDDLVNAIAKLRGGINQLNKEARERLQIAFAQVNERFENLFKLLFGGGRAHLELQDAEDPADAGLEIYASPPGKRLQVLTLLSGGERTLTALALLFSVFMTNPSPICVLDEAEAALDESNVDRFCKLIRTIAEQTGTRFLIITHQRLTMARVDRLYGVTMSEKGVSKLVSVNLDQAVDIIDKPGAVAQMAISAAAA